MCEWKNDSYNMTNDQVGQPFNCKFRQLVSFGRSELQARENWRAACLEEDPGQAWAAEAGNVDFPKDFQGFRITIIICVFLAGGGGPEMQNVHEFPLFSNVLARKTRLCFFLAFAVNIPANASFSYVI